MSMCVLNGEGGRTHGAGDTLALQERQQWPECLGGMLARLLVDTPTAHTHTQREKRGRVTPELLAASLQID